MPAFILCLLFTNLELRLMLLIFQFRSQNANIREVICKFNLITYGGLLLMYPILIYTNLSIFFFIGISLVFIPQIYANGIEGHRPNISSPYYQKFLLIRFLLVVRFANIIAISEMLPVEHLLNCSKLLLRGRLRAAGRIPTIFVMDSEKLWSEESPPQVFAAASVQLSL